MINVQGLKKSYADAQVLKGIDIEVADGEVFGFVGPNGAGKSTFLKCVLGIVRANSGRVSLGVGSDLVDALADPLGARQRVGYSPGETTLYERMPAKDFVRFALAAYPQADVERAWELLRIFGLPESKKIKSFSHGMKRKLLLSQAIASQAPVLMLDEPMEGLDPEARRIVEQILSEEAEAGRTVFFSSHDLASVERICDRVAFLRGGRILETGTMASILDRASHILHVSLRKELGRDELPNADGWQWEGSGTRWRLQFEGELEHTLERLSSLPLAGVRDGSGRLEEVFDSLYGKEGERLADQASGGTA